MVRARIARGLWWLFGTCLVVLFLKAFVADVYRVESGSMRPTIFGGVDPRGGEPLHEHVLVQYARHAHPDRFDLVVLQRRGGDVPIVKRVVGLPGEAILLSEGDVFVDGSRVARAEPRPVPVALFDDRFLEVEDFFRFEREPRTWQRVGTDWALDAREISRGSDRGLMFFQRDLRDGYLDQDHRRVVGSRQVNDGVLECEFRVKEAVGRLRFRIVEEGDVFEVVLDAGYSGDFAARLERQTAGPDPAERVVLIDECDVDVEPGRWYAARFANIDNHLTFELDDEPLLSGSYDENSDYLGPRTGHEKSVGSRLAFGGEGCRVRFRGIRVLRDLFYTGMGEYGIGSSLTLGPDEYFLLGDNSGDSSDSRFYGPVRSSEIVGRPVAVVWPLDRMRLLSGAKHP